MNKSDLLLTKNKFQKNHDTAKNLNETDLNRIIEMAWEDRTPFDALKIQFGLGEIK